MESDSLPKIDLVVDRQPVGQLGLAKFPDSLMYNENTDYSDSEEEEETKDSSEGVQGQNETSGVPIKRTSARIQLAKQTGDFHKRTRYA